MGQVQGLHHVALRCADLGRCEAFYREVLGLPVLRRWPDEGGGDRSVWLSTTTIIVSICKNITSPNSNISFFKNASAEGATCFNILAANVTIDCNGNSITGNGTDGTYGIYSNSANTTVRNCNIYNFSSAIMYDGSSGSAYNNTFFSSIGAHLQLGQAASGNTFHWNNFTESAAAYVNESSIA